MAFVPFARCVAAISGLEVAVCLVVVCLVATACEALRHPGFSRTRRWFRALGPGRFPEHLSGAVLLTFPLAALLRRFAPAEADG